jgi:hypothetical protein
MHARSDCTQPASTQLKQATSNRISSPAPTSALLMPAKKKPRKDSTMTTPLKGLAVGAVAAAAEETSAVQELQVVPVQGDKIRYAYHLPILQIRDRAVPIDQLNTFNTLNPFYLMISPNPKYPLKAYFSRDGNDYVYYMDIGMRHSVDYSKLYVIMARAPFDFSSDHDLYHLASGRREPNGSVWIKIGIV